MMPDFFSTWINTKRLFNHPYIYIRDITDHVDGGADKDAYTALPVTVGPKGPNSCFEQAPNGGFSHLLAADRHYFVEWRDKYNKQVRKC